MSDIDVVEASQLSERHWSAWLALHRSGPALASPFLHPEFTRHLVAAGRDVLVAVGEAGGEVALLYPFEREGSRGRPAGWPLNDFQSVLARPGQQLDVAAFMAAAKLKTHVFDHMMSDRAEFAHLVERAVPSPYLDVSGGLDAYRERLGTTGRRTLSETLRRGRRAVRDLGPLRLELRSEDEAVMPALLAWKGRQYEETGAVDVLADPAHLGLLTALAGHDGGEEFSGTLTALWAGDTLLAAHLGMRAGGVLHWWFPTYDQAQAEYSPGRLMLAQLAEHAPDLGLDRIDLGKNMGEYKRRAMTGSVDVWEGRVETRAAHRLVRRARLAGAQRARSTRAFSTAKQIKAGYRATGSITAAVKSATS